MIGFIDLVIADQVVLRFADVDVVLAHGGGVCLRK